MLIEGQISKAAYKHYTYEGPVTSNMGKEDLVMDSGVREELVLEKNAKEEIFVDNVMNDMNTTKERKCRRRTRSRRISENKSEDNMEKLHSDKNQNEGRYKNGDKNQKEERYENGDKYQNEERYKNGDKYQNEERYENGDKNQNEDKNQNQDKNQNVSMKCKDCEQIHSDSKNGLTYNHIKDRLKPEVEHIDEVKKDVKTVDRNVRILQRSFSWPSWFQRILDEPEYVMHGRGKTNKDE